MSNKSEIKTISIDNGDSNIEIHSPEETNSLIITTSNIDGEKCTVNFDKKNFKIYSRYCT